MGKMAGRAAWKRTLGRAVIGVLLPALLFNGMMQGAGAFDAGVGLDGGAVAGEIPGLTGAADAASELELPDGVPVLDVLPEISRETYVELSGYAEAGSEVAVYYSLEGGAEQSVGAPVTAVEDGSGLGRFQVSVEMEQEGTYAFTAASSKDGVWSERSRPATIRLDWTAPYDVPSIRWELLSNTDVLMTWEPAVLEDGTPDPEVAGYVVYDDRTNKVLAETHELFYRPEGLEAAGLYHYRVASVDLAGNESGGQPVSIGTSPATETRLIELHDRYAGDVSSRTAISGDGSVVVVLDRTAAGSQYMGLFAVDTQTRERVLITEARGGQDINGAIGGLAIDYAGDIVVFASDASNLPASPELEGMHVYAYSRARGEMELLSQPGGMADGPAVSSDGRWVVYTEDDHVYLHDRQSGDRKLVSRSGGDDPTAENGGSGASAISGNGSTVAFLSDSSNLEGFAAESEVGQQAIYVYDAATDRLVGRHVFDETHAALALNEDGRYLAYLESDASGMWMNPYLLDRATGDITYLNGMRRETEVSRKSYNKLWLSGDARYTLADLYDYDPDVLYNYRYSELFDLNDLAHPVPAGNPALAVVGSSMNSRGDRIAYTRGGGLYMYCLGECEGEGQEGPISSAYWSVSDSSWLNGELKQGSKLAIQAAGEGGQQLRAVIAYRSEPADENGALRTMTVNLAELDGAGGIYRGVAEIGAGMAELTSIVVQTADGTAAIELDRLPIPVAASLVVDIATERLALLEGTKLVLTGGGGGAYAELPVQAGTLRYTLPLASGSGYRLELTHGSNGTVLAERSGLTVRRGESAGIVLEPVFAAKVSARLVYSRTPAEQAVVLFHDAADGSLLGEIRADELGAAVLPDALEAGRRVRVTVLPPEGFLAPVSREMTLDVGENQAEFLVQSSDSVIYSVNMVYSQQTSSNFPAPVMESDAKVRVYAVAGLELQAEVVYKRWSEEGELEEQSRPVALSESGYGQYTGDFRIEEGIAYIDYVRVSVSGAWSGNRYTVGHHVAGRVKVRLELPQGEAWSEAPRNGGIRVYFTGNYSDYYSSRLKLEPGAHEYIIDLPKGGIAYRVALEPGSSLLMPMETVAPESEYGRVKEVTLRPKFRVQISGTATGEKNAWVAGRYVLKSMEGEVLVRGSASNYFDIRLESDASARYKLEYTPSDPLYESEEVEIAVNEPVTRLTVELRSKMIRPLAGKVYGADGRPTGGVSVTAVYEGKNKTFYAVTKADGSYTLQLPEGTAAIRASGNGVNGYLSRMMTAEITEAGGQTLDLRLYDRAKVRFKLYTKQYGSDWQGPLELDWRLASVLAFQSSHTVGEYGAPMKVHAAPGDTFRLCVNGANAQLPAGCSEAVIGENNEAELELRLEGSGAQATAQFVKPDGSGAGTVRMELTRLVDGKAGYEPYTIRQQGKRYIVELSKRGQYRLQVYGAGGSSAVVEFAAESATAIDLGVIKLQRPGKFGGYSGNGLGASAETMTPDGKLTVRALYRNAGYPALEASQAELLMHLPEGMALVPGSVVVNGQAAAVADVDAGAGTGTGAGGADGKLRIPIGDIPAGGSGIVQLGLQAEGTNAPLAFMLTGSIGYADAASGGRTEETLGTAYVQVASVTLRVPEVLVKPEFRLSGMAPARATVYVYEGQRLLGTAEVSPEGTWQLDAVLSDTRKRRINIRTEARADGKLYAGQEAIVAYDPNDPGLYEMSVGQAGGRVHTIRPEDGVAVFPLVYVPGQPFVYKLKFRDPARIADVQVWTGDTVAGAVWSNGEYVAAMKLTGDPGPVHVTYRTKADAAAGAGEPPTEEELRSTLPGPMRDFVVEHAAGPGEPGQDGKPVPNGTVSATLRMTKDLGARVTIRSADRMDYTPTERDLQHVQRTGIPVYGSSVSITRGERSARLSLSGRLAGGGGNGLASAGRGFGSLAFGVKEFEMIVDALNMGTKIIDLDSALETAVKPPMMEKLRALRQAAQELCDPRAAEYYTDMADGVIFDAIFVEYVKNALNAVGSIKLSGLAGLLFWAEGYWAGKQLDSVVDGEIAELEKYLQLNECKIGNKPVKPKTEPKADPKYIYDPSGYVYEGLESNRLEGVTATVLQLDEAGGSWDVWDAAWYEQENPQTTDSAGRYGWDVPPGWWKVKYEKAGYVTAYSADLQVPPPHFDVNVGLVSYEAPVVTHLAVRPGGGGIDMAFSKPIKVSSLTEDAVKVTDAGGARVAGSVVAEAPSAGVSSSAGGAATGSGGELLTMAASFRPDVNLTVGGTYTVEVGGMIVSYADSALERYGPQSILIEAEDTVAPAPVGGLLGSMADGVATLVWTDPADRDLQKLLLRWRASGSGEADYGEPIEIAKGQQWANVSGLDRGAGYDFAITALDAYSNESAAAVWTLESVSGGPDLTGPAAVSGLAAVSVGSNTIQLRWKDPAAPDLAKVVVRWRAAATGASGRRGDGSGDRASSRDSDGSNDRAGGSGESKPGSQTLVLSGLSPATAYIVEVVAVDVSGNESFAARLEVVTAADGGSGGSGGGDGGTGGGGLPPADPDAGSGSGSGPGAGYWTVGLEGGYYEAFDGALKLYVPEAAASPVEWRLGYRMTADSVASAPAGYVRLSPSYLLEGGAKALPTPMRLTLAYGVERATGADGVDQVDGTDGVGMHVYDPRRYAIYRKDDAAAGGWAYVGGLLDEASGTIEADIGELGEYAVLMYEASFADLAGHWGRADAEVLASRHIVNGAGDGQFMPERPITRAELAKLLVVLLRQAAGETAGGSGTPKGMAAPVFADVPETAWYAPYIAAAAQHGLMQGADGFARPEEPVTREEVAVMLNRFANLTQTPAAAEAGDPLASFRDAGAVSADGTRDELADFADAAAISDWAKNAMRLAVRRGWINGVSPGELAPQATATRAQTAAMLLRMLTQLGWITKQR